MKQSSAGNLAISLALLAWPLVYYGAMSQIGDYQYATPREIIEANHRISVAILTAGFLCLLGSLWLAGYSFTGAKIRSGIATVIGTGLIALGIAGLFL